jgi:hypothetical protein
MNYRKELPLLTLLAGISVAIGFFVPVLFEWGQKPASRSRLPTMERAAIAALVLTIVACALVVWLRKPAGNSPVAARPRLQFGLRGLFAATTVAAVLLAASRWLGVSLSSGLVVAAAFCAVGWSLCQGAAVSWRVGALLACLFFPFVWMIAFNVPFGRTSGLVTAIPFGPALLPAELIRVLTDASIGPDGSASIAAVIVIGELALGAWLAGRGGKLWLVYLILVLLVSSVSSLGMHVGYRA